MPKSILIPAAVLALSGAALAGEPGQELTEGVRAASIPARAPDFVDLVAADFYETGLRLAQSRLIEAETAQRYLSLTGRERDAYRAERRRIWRAMSEEEKADLRGTKTPRFANLDEAQKQTFRRIAAEELGGGRSTRLAARGDI